MEVDNRYYFQLFDRLYYFDDYRNVYQDGLLIHDGSFGFGNGQLQVPDFYIEGIPFWFDPDGLLSVDQEGEFHRIVVRMEDLEPTAELTDAFYNDVEMEILDPLEGSSPVQGNHMALDRSSIDRYRCPICDRILRRLSALKNHMNVHSGQKPHVCPFEGCNRGFVTKSNMKRHFPVHCVGPLEQYQPNQITNVSTYGRGTLLPNAKVSQLRVSELIIGHNTDLPTIIGYLLQNGCKDISSRLTNVPSHARHSGRQSDVYYAELHDGTAVAVKCLRGLISSDSGPNKILKHTARELYTWSMSSHPNILELAGLAVVRDKLAMVSPWMEYGSLRAYLVARPEADWCKLCAQVAEGLNYMHKLGVAHGDIKGSNVVVSKDGVAKITDFGCTTMKREFAVAFTCTESINFSTRWAAPEMFSEDGTFSFETDVYAFGMTILEVLTGDVPYKEQQSDMGVMHAVLIRKELPCRPYGYISATSRMGDELWHLMQRCWDTQPKLRPRVWEIRDFLKSIAPSDIVDG